MEENRKMERVRKMSINLNLGFFRKPLGITRVLAKKGFKLKRTYLPNSLGYSHPRLDDYSYFNEKKSEKEIFIHYSDGVFGDESFLESCPECKAQAHITTYSGRNMFDEKKQREIAMFLSNHYGAILEDPQKGIILNDPRQKEVRKKNSIKGSS